LKEALDRQRALEAEEAARLAAEQAEEAARIAAEAQAEADREAARLAKKERERLKKEEAKKAGTFMTPAQRKEAAIRQARLGIRMIFD
jgi:translation initiation factor 5B